MRYSVGEFLQVAGLLRHFSFDLADVSAHPMSQVPFFRQRQRELHHFDGVEWFFEDQ